MKTITKLLTLLVIVILLGSCKRNSTESIDIKTGGIVTIDINPEEEFNTINSYINNKQVDSLSENSYTYWLKDGEIIKLYVYDGDGENYGIHEEYYFKNKKVCAYKKKEINFPDAIDYTALIFIKNSSISKEEYWIQDVKKKKTELEIELTKHEMSIQNNILIDGTTNKPINLLFLSDLSKKLGFNDNILSNPNTINKQNSEDTNSGSTKTFNDIQLTLMDGSLKKAKLYLGEPDKYEFGFGHVTKGFAVYYNRVTNQNETPKHLVLFLRMDNSGQWGNDAKIEEIYSVDDNQKACFGIHCIMINNKTISTNALDLIHSRGYEAMYK